MPMNNRIMVPRQSFSPLKVPGAIAWLDASNLASLSQTSDGLTPITATNDPVGYCRDLTGLGNHALQTVATGSRPLVVFNSQGGRSGLSFDGTNDFLTATIAGFQSLTGVTVIQVFKTVAAAAANANTLIGWGFGNDGALSGGYPASRSLAVASTTGVFAGETIYALIDPSGATGRLGSSTYARAANTSQFLATRMSTAGTSMVANGTAVGLGLASVVTASTDSSPVATGYTNDNDLHIGALRTSGSLIYTPAMTLFEQVVYSRALTDAEIGYLWRGFRAKWGIV